MSIWRPSWRHLGGLRRPCWPSWEVFGGHVGRLGGNLSRQKAILSQLGANLGPPCGHGSEEAETSFHCHGFFGRQKFSVRILDGDRRISKEARRNSSARFLGALRNGRHPGRDLGRGARIQSKTLSAEGFGNVTKATKEQESDTPLPRLLR